MRKRFDQFEHLEKEMDVAAKKTLSQKNVLVKKNNELRRRMLKLCESPEQISEMYNELQERISDIYPCYTLEGETANNCIQPVLYGSRASRMWLVISSVLSLPVI